MNAATDLSEMTPDQLVNKLWDKRIRNDVIRRLLGGLTATELRRLHAGPEVRDAVVRGLQHPSPPVRYWCLWIIDHAAEDESWLRPVIPLLNDPIKRVRRMARHALECDRCKHDPALAEVGKAYLAKI
jgi:hypothetical protein